MKSLGWLLAEIALLSAFIGGTIAYPELGWLHNLGTFIGWVQVILIVFVVLILSASNSVLDDVISGKKKPPKDVIKSIANYKEATLFMKFIRICGRGVSLGFLGAFAVAGWYVTGFIWLFCAIFIAPATMKEIRTKTAKLSKKVDEVEAAETTERVQRVFGGDDVRIVDV